MYKVYNLSGIEKRAFRGKNDPAVMQAAALTAALETEESSKEKGQNRSCEALSLKEKGPTLSPPRRGPSPLRVSPGPARVVSRAEGRHAGYTHLDTSSVRPAGRSQESLSLCQTRRDWQSSRSSG